MLPGTLQISLGVVIADPLTLVGRQSPGRVVEWRRSDLEVQVSSYHAESGITRELVLSIVSGIRFAR